MWMGYLFPISDQRREEKYNPSGKKATKTTTEKSIPGE